MSFKAEVIADDSGEWVTNSLAFATEQEAEAYAQNLSARWMLVREKRVVPSEDPVNYSFADGQLTRLETS